MDTSNAGSPLDTLDTLRNDIDALDDQLVALMARRLDLARRTLEPKSRQGLPTHDPGREAAVVRRAAATARAVGLEPEPVRDIFWRLIDLARHGQSEPRSGTAPAAGDLATPPAPRAPGRVR